jgi:hypothetical protein
MIRKLPRRATAPAPNPDPSDETLLVTGARAIPLDPLLLMTTSVPASWC